MKRSPLENVLLPSGMREVRFLAQVNLRVDPSDAGVMNRLASLLGYRLPSDPNTVSGGKERYALWLGPDEWLLVGPPESGYGLERGCREASGHAAGSVVDVSASRAIIELRGPSARGLLEAGCAIDLHPRAFHAGCCAQTLLARTAVIVHQVNDEPLYRLYVRPSFAAYLAAWLDDATGRSTVPAHH